MRPASFFRSLYRNHTRLVLGLLGLGGLAGWCLYLLVDQTVGTVVVLGVIVGLLPLLPPDGTDGGMESIGKNQDDPGPGPFL